MKVPITEQEQSQTWAEHPTEEEMGDSVCGFVVVHVLCSLRMVFSAGLPSTIGSHTIQHFPKQMSSFSMFP